MHRIDGPGATVDRQFTEEIPEQGIPATDISAAWLTAVQEEIATVIETAGIVLDKAANNQLVAAIIALTGSGVPVTLDVESTLLAGHGLTFFTPGADATLPQHLPVYADVGAAQRFRMKNLGPGIVRLDALDGKTINSQAYLDLAPGDAAEIAKDGAAWQTI